MVKPDARRSPGHRLAAFPEAIQIAVRAAGEKKAQQVTVMDLRPAQAFTDTFVICSGTSTRQVKAIVDSIEEMLKKAGVRPAHVEGLTGSDWVLMDYFDFVVHVFTPETRAFYGLERLWGSAEVVDVQESDLQ
jgi:ribosome-associated protein